MTWLARAAMHAARLFLNRHRAEDVEGDLYELYQSRLATRGRLHAEAGLLFDLLSALAARPADGLRRAAGRLLASLPFGALAVACYLVAHSDRTASPLLFWLIVPGLMLEMAFWLRLLGASDVAERPG